MVTGTATPEVVKLLTQFGANIMEPAEYQPLSGARTSLQLAIQQNRKQELEIMLATEAGKQAILNKGWDLLGFAAKQGSKESIKSLIKWGALPGNQTEEKYFCHPLLMAAKHQDWEGYKLIFELEPNLDLLTREKENLLQCVAKNPQTSEILKKLIDLEYYDINYQDQYGNTALHHTYFSSHSRGCENVLISLEAEANPEIQSETSRRQPLILSSCSEGKPC